MSRMTKPVNIPAIEKATKTPWANWVEYLDKAGGRDLPHRAIADLAYAKSGDGWWSQSIAVAYEQHIGRRLPGQRSDGSFEASVSKTLAGTPTDLMELWTRRFGGVKDFNGTASTASPTTSGTGKRAHWARNLDDGTRVNVDADTYGKPAGKAGITITHTKLASSAEAERWKIYWKEILAKL